MTSKLSPEPTPIPVPVSIAPLEIRYFKFTDDHFPKKITGGASALWYDATIEDIPLSPGEYLDSTTNLSTLDIHQSDTTILNFQVGRGKTKVLYDYIEQYLTLGDEYVIFYCIPFIRLLREINGELKTRGITTFDCTKIKSGKATQFTIPDNFGKRVQLMTPDFLLGSGGKKITEQSGLKKSYKEKLRQYLKDNDRKVILIIDEIHEKTELFDSLRLPHLYLWKKLVHKVFIASATFTQDSAEVSKTVALLTDQKITVYQADRGKASVQADLHLHVCSHNFSTDDLHPLGGLNRVIGATSGRRTHILTAYKGIAEKLNDPKGKSIPIPVAAVSTLKAKKLTGDDSGTFKESRNSIGTTFKTGVNITDNNAVLIMILPGRAESDNRDPDEVDLGAFTDMTSSVVQAFARIRNGGDIHVFLPPFTTYMDTLDEGANKTCRLLQKKLGGETTPPEKPISEGDLLGEFKRVYSDRRKELDLFMTSVDPATATAYEKEVGFESLYDYLLTQFAEFKDTRSQLTGRGLGPLILWMALTDQFSNCTLKTITVESYTPPTVELTATNLEGLFKKGYRSYEPKTTPENIFDAVARVLNVLDKDPKDPSGSSTVYSLDRKNKGPIRQLYQENKTIGAAIFSTAQNLFHKSQHVDRKSLFTTLVKSARSTSDSDTVEFAYYSVQNALKTLTEKVLDSGIVKSGKVYLRSPLSNNLTPSDFDETVVSLAELEKLDPQLIHKNIYFPRQSARNLPPGMTDREKYEKVVTVLLQESLDLIAKDPSRKGRKDLFGEDTPYFTIKL